MKTSTFLKPVRSGFISTLVLCTLLASGSEPSLAVNPCGPTERPNAIGTCETCSGLITSASISPASLGVVFGFAGIQNASYTISNNVGTFNIAGTSLATFNFKAPPPAAITLPPVQGSVAGISYEAYPSIPNLTLTWGAWTGGAAGVVLAAQLSGQINIHISAAPVVVNPTLTLTNLPVTVTFGADSTGDATISSSQVVVASVGSFGSVGGCGAVGWCNGVVSGAVESAVQSQLQSALASQFSAALNGQNNASPFWQGFMNTLANQTVLQVLVDPAGNPLPKVNQATPGGTATSWTVIGDFAYASGIIASFSSSEGLCYLDCTPMSQAQLCGASSCGAISDGCGGEIPCSACGGGKICKSNRCVVCAPLTCANLGYTCGELPRSNGCGGSLICNIRCPVETTCTENGQCVGADGANGAFCSNCRSTGGTCIVGAGGMATCIHQ
jgi:hypothetical protein